MSEIRDFLKPMTVPVLNDTNFAINFEAFCRDIRDNINNIVSAPFLKGDRGSKVIMQDEPLKIDGEWTEFAIKLMETIYDIPYGDPRFPLLSGGELLLPPQNEELSLIDGGETPVPKYSYTSYADDTTGEEDSQGFLEVVSQTYNDPDDPSLGGITTIKIVSDNKYNDKIGQIYNIDSLTWDEGRYQLYKNDVSVDMWLEISTVPEEAYHLAYDAFNTITDIKICYDEASGEKIFWVPFYFFDGRINYIKYIDTEKLPLFHDMSCTIWGKASFIGDDIVDAEDLSNPDNWDWEMHKTYSLPKIYYNTQTQQFCWEIAGTQTNIIAQGVKGDKGQDAQTWICEGHLEDDEEIIQIDYIYYPTGAATNQINKNDLCLVFYNRNDEIPYPEMRCQFGLAHVGSYPYIDNLEQLEIIQKLRDSSIHDDLQFIGNPAHIDPLTICSVLYTMERVRSTPVDPSTQGIMALWAKDTNDHYLAPILLAKASTNEDTEVDPLERDLNILYRTTKFFNDVQINGKLTTTHNSSVATSVYEESQHGTNMDTVQYMLGALCNILEVKSQTQLNPSYVIGGSSNQDNYIYLLCDLIIGWVPTGEYQIYKNAVDPQWTPLDIYRAQHQYFYLRVPKNGTSWANLAFCKIPNNVYKNTSNINPTTILGNWTQNMSFSYMGMNGQTLTLKANNMNFTEYVPKIHIDGRVVRGDAWDGLSGYDKHYNSFKTEIPGLDLRNEVRSVDKVNKDIYYQTYIYTNIMDDSGNCPHSLLYSFDVYPFGDHVLDIPTKRYYLNGSLKLELSSSISIQNLFNFPVGYASVIDSDYNIIQANHISEAYPLYDRKYSFLSFFQNNSTNTTPITTTNNEGGYMWQGNVMKSYPQGDDSKPMYMHLINMTYFDSLCPPEYNFKMASIPATSSAECFSDIKYMQAPIRVYPDGMNSLRYFEYKDTQDAAIADSTTPDQLVEVNP